MLYSNFVATLNTFGYSTLCIDVNDNVWGFGSNNLCKLGKEYDSYEENYIPTQINSLTNIKYLSCGSDHTICCNYDGDVWSFGSNNYCQLGLGKSTCSASSIPCKVINLPPIQNLSCGIFFTICLSYDGNLYSFGNNGLGQLGLGKIEENSIGTPTMIPGLNDINFIECGGFFAICKTNSGDYYAWGESNPGQLGIGDNKSDVRSPIKCTNWPNIVSIKCGSIHTLLLSDEGNVYACGSNRYGQLGIDNVKEQKIPKKIENLPEIRMIECGYEHSICIDIENNFWGFGLNGNGQLGLGDKINKTIPIKNTFLSNIHMVSHGGKHTFVKTYNNEIYSFGNNSEYQLGVPQLGNQLKPKRVLENKEDIWKSNTPNSRKKSARK